MKYQGSKLYNGVLQSGIYFCFIIAAQQASLAHGISIQGASQPVHAGQPVHNQDQTGKNAHGALTHNHSAVTVAGHHHHHHANQFSVEFNSKRDFANYFGLNQNAAPIINHNANQVSNSGMANASNKSINTSSSLSITPPINTAGSAAANAEGNISINAAANIGSSSPGKLAIRTDFGVNAGTSTAINQIKAQGSGTTSIAPHQGANALGTGLSESVGAVSPNGFKHEDHALAMLAQARVQLQGGNLDLASTKDNVIWTGGSVTIQVGNTTKVLTMGEHITAAELQAGLEKIDGTGVQSLFIGSNGAANGGTLVVTVSSMRDYNLVLPAGVTLDIRGASTTNPFVVLGGVKVDGTIDFLSAKGNPIADLKTANLLIGSAGKILDKGTLDLNAYSFDNAGTISAGALNLNIGSGTIVNSGTITASNGNVTFNTPMTQNLVLNNTGGTVQANNGAINVRDSNYTGAADTRLTGGNYLSQTLNLNAGNGNLNVNVGQVTGLVNETALNAHTIAASSDLKLGDLKISGDPLFYNLTGDVTLTSGTYAGQPYSVAAAGNILGAGTSISTANSSGNGGDITMVAGAALTLNSDGSVTVTGPTATGGYITLGSLDASGSNQAGNVILMAFGGAAGAQGPGDVAFNSISANGGTGSLGQDGNVYIFACVRNFGFPIYPPISPASVGTATISATGSTKGQGTVELGVLNVPQTGTFNISSTGQVENLNIADFIQYAPITPGGMQNISITASASITLNTAIATNMNLVISPQYSGASSSSGIFFNTFLLPNPGGTTPAWSGPITYTGSMNAGQYQIQIVDASGQNISFSGGTFAAGQGINVLATPNSSFITGITYTGPLSNYSAWVNGTPVESGITVASGQTQTVSFASNTGAATPGYNIGPAGVTLLTINTGSTSSSFGPGVTGFTFGAGAPPVTLSSLDLGNSSVQSTITSLLAANTPGLSGTDAALVINASISLSTVTLNALTAMYVPSGDSITFTGFGSGSQAITVNLTGSSTTKQVIDSGTISFTNSGNSSGTLTITSNQTGPALLINSGGVLNSDHALTVSAPSMQINGSMSATSSLTATATAGNIYGSGGLHSPTMSLIATGGNIGGDVNGVTALAVGSGGTGGLTLSTAGNAINLSDTTAEAVTLGTATATNTASTSFSLNANGNIAVGNNVGSGTCTLASLTTTGSNFIEDAGSGSYGVIASSVILDTPAGQVGTPGFRVNCTTLAVNTTGNVHVANSGTATLAINASSGNSLAITSNGTMDINGNVTGSTSVTLQTAAGSNGNIIIGANVGTYGANTTTTLVTDGSGNIADVGPGTNVVQAHLLNMASTTGNIGSPGLRTIADEINCTTGGNVHLNNIGTGPVTFLSVTGGGSFFQVLANSTITVTQPIFAPNTMLLSVVSGNGSIIINGPVGTTSSSTSVSVEGTGSITTGTGGAIFGSTVIVNNPFGNIGSSTTPLSIAGNNVSVNAVNGLVNVANSIGGAVTLGNVPGNVVGAGKSFAFSTTGTGPLTVYSVTSGNGNLSIVNNVGGMSVAAGATLSSTNGNITLQDTDTVNGSIAFGANVTVHASATADGVGKVYAVIGAIPNNPVVGNKPAHVTVNNTDGGITYFGTNSITATGSNTLNASGRNIVFNTGLLPASKISLAGGVTITADPPVSDASSVMNSVHNSSTLSGQVLGQNLINNGSLNPLLFNEQMSTVNNTAIGITTASVQLLNNETENTKQYHHGTVSTF